MADPGAESGPSRLESAVEGAVFILGLVVFLVLLFLPASVWAQNTLIVQDGTAMVVSVGTQGPAGANIPAGGSEGLIPAKVGGGFGWSGAKWNTGLDYLFDLPILLPNTSSASSYVVQHSGTTFSGTYDPVFQIGYNLAPGTTATPLIAGTHIWKMSLEGDYFGGGVHYAEYNLDFQAGTDPGTGRRPIAISVRHSAPWIVMQTFNADIFRVSNEETGVAIFEVAKNPVDVKHTITVQADYTYFKNKTGNNTVAMNTANGMLSLSGNFIMPYASAINLYPVLDPEEGQQAQLIGAGYPVFGLGTKNLAAAYGIYFPGSLWVKGTSGTIGQAMAGYFEAPTFATTFNWALKTTGANLFSANAVGNLPLAIRGANGQTANLQEWQNSAGALLAGVTKDGTVLLPTGTATAKALAWASAPDTGLYLPDQTNFSGTLIFGNSGSALSHVGGADGQKNSYLGLGAGYSSTTGYYNSAQGFGALFSNTTGIYNTAIGTEALRTNATTHNNTAIGTQALYSNIAADNTAVGTQVLFSNTTGTLNTAAGTQGLYKNTTGNYNMAVGGSALYWNTTGSGNVGIGVSALFNSIGNYSTAVGMQAGAVSGATPTSANAVTSGSSLTFIGYQSGLGSTTQRTNSAAIGYQAYVDADNTVVLGDENVTAVLAGSASQATVQATKVTLLPLALAALGTPANGTIAYCSDCAPQSNPCTGTSTGAIAKRLNGAWDCR